MDGIRDTNKYGVPYHMYSLKLADGTSRDIDVGCEEDWGNIQEMDTTDYPGSMFPAEVFGIPGWGNAEDGHIEIVAVKDLDTGRYVSVREWAEKVWSYVENYSEGSK